MKRLPIGIQTFRQIIEGDYTYVDKTGMAYDLITSYKYAFLSRPRRFGKSLFLDTLHNIFEGHKELFEGLAIYDQWDWSQSYPVIRISWAGDFSTLESTQQAAFEMLELNQKRLGIVCTPTDSPAGCFRKLIIEAYEKYQTPVVVLVDEYDKPILDNITSAKRALENRDFLRSFYVMLKESDAYIRFAFLTGISKFSKANIFSGLNNLEDISLVKRFGNICGYTQQDLETVFAEHLEGADMKRVQEWYNGYNFLGDALYNPFDILKFIRNDLTFDNYWWESGNPYFLIEMLKQRPYNLPELENITVGKEILNTFEVENLKLEVLLFQSGYLTIDRVEELPIGGFEYKLKVPNMEVQLSLNNLFLEYLTNEANNRTKLAIYRALQSGDMAGFEETIKSLFAAIPYHNYVKNTIGDYEGYYASVLYAYLAASGLKIVAEDVTNEGRIDLTILMGQRAYILEFKVGEGDPLGQIKEKNYAQKYRADYDEIYLIGITFDPSKRNIKAFEWEIQANP